MNRPTDTAEVRRSNLALVLRALDRLAPCSRTDLRAATGLVSGSVSSLVDELIARGLVVEAGKVVSPGRGRPRRVLDLSPGRVSTLSVQLTHAETVGEVRDFNGEVRWQSRVAHSIRPGVGGDVVDTVASAINRTVQAARALGRAWSSGIVVALPAAVVDGRAIGAALDFGIGHTELLEPLRGRLEVPTDLLIMNSGRLGALAEYNSIALADRPKVMAYVNSGPGMSGGIVVDGDLYLGSHLMAGECGHIGVAFDGPPCACGARGCLSLYAGNDGMLEAALLGDFAASHGRERAITELLAQAERGESRATEVLARAGAALAAAVGTMTNYTDVDLVVLGGSLPRFERWIRPAVTAFLEARARIVPEFAPAIATARLGEDAIRMGAWMLGRESVLRDPAQVPVLAEGVERPAHI